ncbi:F-box/FBD/LRR-repeat protein [Tanacetum coccineum]|uniref:F-box/FBD/LRR-repeat protein n=1 Tax=Tanacetum coccineum TaxID=301880 RepID=A0ABQ5GF54_9ASTR
MVFNTVLIATTASVSADIWQSIACSSERISGEELLDLVICFPLQELAHFVICVWNFLCLPWSPHVESYYSSYSYDHDDEYLSSAGVSFSGYDSQAGIMDSSQLPSSIIESILCLVPIQEAARTSILSREWMYRWTKIPNLVFEEDTFQVSTVDGAESSILDQILKQLIKRRTMDKKSKLIYAICQVLLIHDGPIKFTLSLCLSRKHVKIDPMLTYLSRKTRVKKLKKKIGWSDHSLPLSHFSFGHLTDLCLIRCRFHIPPTFNRVGSLTSLYLHEDIRDPCISGSIGGPTISEIFECLPVIETFSISLELIRVFRDIAMHEVPRELSTTLIHLKYLRIDGVYFTSEAELSVLALLIKSSPNLEKLKARVWDDSNFEMSKRRDNFRVEDYSDIMLERLIELEITSFINAKNQLDFVRLILARSPVLKKVRIFPHYKIRKKEKLKIKSQILGDSISNPCASPEVQIIVAG